ncbi:hypothetical protein ACLX1H_002887 [Fusarium chlamydosporum]
MHFSSILPALTLLAGLTSAMPVEDDDMLETRDAGGINLIKLRIAKGKSYTGVGKPGHCYNLPSNIKSFNVWSDDTKSLVGCFDCKVWTGPNCSGSFVSLEGEQAFLAKGGKKPTYKSWKCQCKNGC